MKTVSPISLQRVLKPVLISIAILSSSALARETDYALELAGSFPIGGSVSARVNSALALVDDFKVDLRAGLDWRGDRLGGHFDSLFTVDNAPLRPFAGGGLGWYGSQFEITLNAGLSFAVTPTWEATLEGMWGSAQGAVIKLGVAFGF